MTVRKTRKVMIGERRRWRVIADKARFGSAKLRCVALKLHGPSRIRAVAELQSVHVRASPSATRRRPINLPEVNPSILL
jgi:hypothetical protein